jgi:hypothetical protein
VEQQTSLGLLDGGIASQANLGLLRQQHYHYLVNDRRRGRAAYWAEFLKEEFFTRVGQREDKSEVITRVCRGSCETRVSVR